MPPSTPSPYGCAARQHPGVGTVAGSLPAPGCASSCACSTAVIQLMTMLAGGAMGAQAPVPANAMCTSWLWTPLLELAWQRMLAGTSSAPAQEHLARQSPLGRAGEGGTDRALWRSDDSAYLTGPALVLAGGADGWPSANVAYGQPPASYHQPHAPSDLHQQTLDADSAFFSTNAIHRPWGHACIKSRTRAEMRRTH